jgi:lysophospholipase L1-like esterase
MCKKIRSFLFLCLVLFLAGSSLESRIERKGIRGKSAHPFLNQQGELRFVYKNPDSGLSFAVRNETSSDYSDHALLKDQDISSPAIKKNNRGEIWIVWEKESFAKNDIYYGKLFQDQVVYMEVVNDWEAFHHSPDFDFDKEHNLWITWVSYSNSGTGVLAKNMTTKQTWVLNSPGINGAHDPKIVVDAVNNIWVFWVGATTGRDKIFYSVLNGADWSLPQELNINNAVPHVFPDVSLGPEGFPMVVWSEYDGDDYEIFYSSWNGERWSAEERITDNDESDSQPVISYISGSVPIVFWSKSFKKGSGIFFKYKHGADWSPEKTLFKSNLETNLFPKIAVLGDRIGITWQSGKEIKAEILAFAQLEERQSQRKQDLTDNVPANPNLDENAYIGFGDSITYGMMNYEETPQLGYIPRLESLLYENYGPSQVINEGFGGEVTEYGLARMPDVISTHKARYLLLMEGTNDVVFKRISMDTTAFNLKEMIKTCRNYGVFVVLSTIIPREDHRWYKPFFKQRIFELNNKIRGLATEVKVPLVDMFDIFFYYSESKGGWTSLLSSDKVHPSIKGYILMTESWFDEIRTLPFPPCEVEANRVRDQIMDFIQQGNVVKWKISTKLSGEIGFRAYKIYRVNLSAEPLSIKLIKRIDIRDSDATVMGYLDFPGLDGTGRKYFDVKINYSHSYKYAVSLVRDDRIEGPLSASVQDITQGELEK